MRVVVIGGGISGLAAAHRLASGSREAGAKLDVVLLEAEPRLGGHAWTTREDGWLVEGGPNAILERPNEPELRALARELGIEARLREARAPAKKRFVLRRGKLHRAPDSPIGVLTTSILSVGGKLRLLREPWAKAAPEGVDETVAEFARRRIGAEAAERLVDAAVAGISAGDSTRLSVRAAFPMLVEMERSHGSLIRAMIAAQRAARRGGPPARSRLVGFDGGMATLVDALARSVGAGARTGCRARRVVPRGGRWSIECEAGAPIEADRLLLALPAAGASRLVAERDPGLGELLGAVPYAGVAMVGLAYRVADVGRSLDGYGYLVDRHEGLDSLGVLWESSLFDDRAPAGFALLRVMMGGLRHPEVLERDDAALVARARAELAGPMGIVTEPVRTWVRRWPASIAQYEIGHLERVAEARRRATRLAGLELCGSSYDGPSFGAAVRSGLFAADRVLATLGDPDLRSPAVPAPNGAPRSIPTTSALRTGAP